MNALIRKEIRLLLPSFVITLLLAFSVWLIPNDDGSISGLRASLVLFPFFLCPAMVVLLALSSFGREISSGTFSALLAHPISREGLWWTKTLVLGIALAAVLCVWMFSFLTHEPGGTGYEKSQLIGGAALFVLAVYSGGLWGVLLFRQVASAFWFTLLIPGALCMVIVNLLEHHPDAIMPLLTAVLVVYSVAGFLAARRMFLRAEDVQWMGGEIALPKLFGNRRTSERTGEKRGWRPRAALFAKEFQLHQSQLIIAGVVGLLHLGVIATRRFGSGFEDSPTLQFLLANFWLVWFAMPLLIGSAAVAEERKLGTLEGQLCLPVRRRTQFAIKLVVALVFSIVLGAVMPLLLEGSEILPDVKWNTAAALGNYRLVDADGIAAQVMVVLIQGTLGAISQWLPFLTLAGVAAMIGAISFYASSLARNTLQALAPALLGIIASWVLLLLANRVEHIFRHPLWRGPLIYLIGVPVLSVTLAWLTYWNFKRVLVGWSLWRRNIFTFVIVLAVVTTSTVALYHRAWERLTPLEPAHGPARLQTSRNLALRSVFGDRLAIQLPGEKIWLSQITFPYAVLSSFLWGKRPTAALLGDGLIEGTNWASVALSDWDVVAVQNDGTLWVSEKPSSIARFRPSTSQRDLTKMVQVDDDHDWKSAVGGNFFMSFLLKTDGTLWRLGHTPRERIGDMPNMHRWLSNFKPRRLGKDSDWAEIFSLDGQSLVLIKTDERAWTFGHSGVPQIEKLRFEKEEIFLERAPLLDRNQWRSVTAAMGPRWGQFRVGVREDGTFRVFSAWQPAEGKAFGTMEVVAVDIQLGHESDWRTVSGNGEIVVTLKADGSLWKWEWEFPDGPVANPKSGKAKRLSRHSDWLALAPALDGIVSLAADGSLWLWQFEPRYYSPERPLLLSVSRKPQRLGNVFDSSLTPGR